MKRKKGLFLFLALLLPIFVFLFLKIFGKNEFAVKPLYHDNAPGKSSDCNLNISLPYQIPDSVLKQVNFATDNLALIWFAPTNRESKKLIDKVSEKYETLPLLMLDPSLSKNRQWEKCIFFLKNNYDMILLDKHGIIRGQYSSADREEIDRLFIELDIILKKY